MTQWKAASQLKSPTNIHLNLRQRLENNYHCSVNVLKNKHLWLIDVCVIPNTFHSSVYAVAVTQCTRESSAAAAACVPSAPSWWSCRCCGRPGRSPLMCWPLRRWSPPRCLPDACRLWNGHAISDSQWWVSDALCPSYSEIILLPVGWWACDHPVDQDAVGHVWEGRVPQLQLSDDAEAERWGHYA